MKTNFRALSISGFLFASFQFASGRATVDRHQSGYNELDTEIDLSDENELITATENPTVSPTENPTVSPTENPTVAPTSRPTVFPIVEADEDPEELEDPSPDSPPRAIDGDNGLSPRGIIGISIGSAFVILAAIGLSRSRRNQEGDVVSADPGEFGPV